MRLLPSPPSHPQGSGIGPLHPPECLPQIWQSLGTPRSLMGFLAFDNYFFPFPPPEKLKHHKIIFVVGKSVSGSHRWWGQGHGPALSPCTPWVGAAGSSWCPGLGSRGWRLKLWDLGCPQVLWGGCGSSPAPRGHGGVCWDQEGTSGWAWGDGVWGDVTVHLGRDVLSANGVVMARYQWDSDVLGPGWGGDLLGVIRQRCPGC